MYASWLPHLHLNTTNLKDLAGPCSVSKKELKHKSLQNAENAKSIFIIWQSETVLFSIAINRVVDIFEIIFKVSVIMFL